jgi:hypothetical protein
MQIQRFVLFCAVGALLGLSSPGPALAVKPSPPTAICTGVCQRCVEFEHTGKGGRCVKCSVDRECLKKASTQPRLLTKRDLVSKYYATRWPKSATVVRPVVVVYHSPEKSRPFLVLRAGHTIRVMRPCRNDWCPVRVPRREGWVYNPPHMPSLKF